ncbi:MAG: FtsQ-type POTRA domain-containing protein [Clostridia bacterium]|nr:FtsQ-type POTRA domain-containing protein [Clostridia bacterium]
MAEHNNRRYPYDKNKQRFENRNGVTPPRRDNPRVVRPNESVESLRRKKPPQNAQPIRQRPPQARGDSQFTRQRPSQMRGEEQSRRQRPPQMRGNEQPIGKRYAPSQQNLKNQKKQPKQRQIRENSRPNTYGDGFDGFEREYKPSNRRAISPKARKARKAMTLTLFVFFAGVVGIVLCLTVFFKTDKISVSFEEGVTPKYTVEEIVAASELSVGENMFLTDKKSATKKVISAFPYIENAEINISLPDTLNIEVVQAEPTYYVEAGKNNYLVLGRDGRILEQNKKITYSIPLIKGVKLEEKGIGEYVEFSAKSFKKILDSVISVAESNELSNLNEIDLTQISDIKIKYDKRILIVLGTNENLDYKMRTALNIITNELSKKDIGTLDVSLCCEGKRQSSFLPDNMVDAANNPIVSTDTDKSTDENYETDTDTSSQDNNEDNTYDDSYDGYDDLSNDGYSNYNDYTYDDSYDYSDYNDNTYDDSYDYNDYNDYTYDDSYDYGYDGDYNG